MIAQKTVSQYGAHSAATLVYFAVCSSCQNEGPASTDETIASTAALDAGWDARHVELGDLVILLYTCPDCLGGGAQ